MLNLKNLTDELKKRVNNFTQNTLPQKAAQFASNPTLNRFATGNVNRVSLYRPQVQNKIGQAAINVGMSIPENFINIPRNLAVGPLRVANEINVSRGGQRPINWGNIAAGVAPFAEGAVDIATLGGAGLAKNIAKGGIREVGKLGIKQIVKKGAISGAKYGGFSGLTYGLDEQYGKKFSLGNVALNTAAGVGLGGALGGGIAGLGGLKGLITRTPEVEGQLRDAVGRWTRGKELVKPKNMPKAQWDFQIKFNKQYNRNPYLPVYDSDLREALNLEAGRRVGMQARDITKDKLSTSLPTQASKVGQPPLYDADEIVYHGGRDLGDNAILKRGFYGGDGKTPTGQDSGGIFFTPDKNYAQGYAGGKGAVYQKTLTKAEKEGLFDLSNKDHVKRFVEGAKKWEGYDSPTDAVNDAKQMIKSMQETARDGVPDWATASQWSEEIRQSGFRGAKFLERPGTVSGNEFDGFNISGKPIISYGFFDDAVPVTKVKDVAQQTTTNFVYRPAKIQDNGSGTIGSSKRLRGEVNTRGETSSTPMSGANPDLPTNVGKQFFNATGLPGGIQGSIPARSSNSNVAQQTMGDLQKSGLVSGFAGTPQKQRGFINTVKEAPTTAPEVAQKVKGTYTPVANKTTVRKASIAVDMEGWDTVKQRVLNSPLTKDTNAEGLELMRRAQDSGRFDEAIDIAETLSKKGTEAGQAVQAFSIWGRMTPEGMLRYAQKSIMSAQENMDFATKFVRKSLGKNVQIGLTEVDASKITDLMRKANAATDEKVKMAYTKDALELINDKIPYGVSDLLDEFRYNNMLSNPKTHNRNMYQNAFNTLVTRPATLIAEGKPIEAVKYYGGVITGGRKAAIDAIEAFEGKTPITQPDIKQLKKSRLPAPFSIPTKALEAQDKFFTGLIKNGMKAAGASEAEANKIATYSLLRQDLKPEQQGILLNSIDKLTEGLYGLRNKVPGAGWFIPFVKTPMNALKQWIEYSPAGVLTMVGAGNKREQLGKALLGSTALYIGAQIAAEDNTTWAAPTDATAKQLFYAAGRKPFSVKVGDKWVPMWYAGPFAFALAIPAAAKNYQDESRTALTDSQLEKLTQTVGDLMNFTLGQTPLTGLNTFAKLAQGDIDYSLSSNLGFTAGQVVPFNGFLSFISKALDPIYRKPQGFAEQIKSNIPGMSQNMEAYTGPMGDPSMRLPMNNLLPYDVGKANTGYEPMLEARTQKLQSNAMENKIKKDIERDKSGGEVVNDKFIYWDEQEAKLTTINMDFNVEKPQLTGNEAVDKRLMSAYKSKLTNKENDIVKLMEQGRLTQEEAVSMINEMEALKTKTSTGTGTTKKPKKITIKTTTYKAPKITIKKRSSTKIPKIVIKKPPKFKTVRRYTIK